MNRLSQVKRMTQMIRSNESIWINSIYMLTFFGKPISLTVIENVQFRWPFLGYFELIQLIQSYRSLKVNRLSHLLYENEFTQSPINSLGKRTESIQSILREKTNRFKSINSVELMCIQVCLYVHNVWTSMLKSDFTPRIHKGHVESVFDLIHGVSQFTL